MPSGGYIQVNIYGIVQGAKYCVCVCVCVCVCARVLSCFSCVWLFATQWTAACKAPLSKGFSRQEYQSGLPCPPPGDLPNLRIKSLSLLSLTLAGVFLTTRATCEVLLHGYYDLIKCWQFGVSLSYGKWIFSFFNERIDIIQCPS